MVPLGCFLEEQGLLELASEFEAASTPSLKWVLMRSQAFCFPEQGRLGEEPQERGRALQGDRGAPRAGSESVLRKTLLIWPPAGPQT